MVYRAHDPRWAFSPESGAGAAIHGGRFNPPGIPALYTSLRFEVAWAEAQQGFAARTQPLTLCTYEVECDDILDLTGAVGQQAVNISHNELACAWQTIAWIERKDPPTWMLARKLKAAGVAGILVPSFAAFASPPATNLVLYEWGHSRPHRVIAIDDRRRLPQNQKSWPST